MDNEELRKLKTKVSLLSNKVQQLEQEREIIDKRFDDIDEDSKAAFGAIYHYAQNFLSIGKYLNALRNLLYTLGFVGRAAIANLVWFWMR